MTTPTPPRAYSVVDEGGADERVGDERVGGRRVGENGKGKESQPPGKHHVGPRVAALPSNPLDVGPATPAKARGEGSPGPELREMRGSLLSKTTLTPQQVWLANAEGTP